MTKARFLAACLAGLFAGPLQALPDAAWQDDAGSVSVPEGVRVPRWNELSAAQRSDLARFEQHWDQMPASRRVAILERYARWQRESPRTRETIREGERNFQQMTPRQREMMRRSIAAVRRLPPEDQRRLRHRWQAMTPQERSRWLERGGPGIAPPPR
ncbi:MAG: DUF3106 domain-containing protein [Gammaproteobacteria bacterium]|nr:DUF3106 domain-containing protein [Gammaproteobacteria bacterium]